ncbi:hypothetical protein cyc_06603 [Cyclospora cayetanensis]|uniref:Uncharacterized protein n=1 Tax=Cyclospora cayetanensis TaxID=88456 RepID=A0A1D3CW57_9EIME|nr:hypothetical protein cyc_06603 [Cyclospora cayetanensis]
MLPLRCSASSLVGLNSLKVPSKALLRSSACALKVQDLRRMMSEWGYTPQQRNAYYENRLPYLFGASHRPAEGGSLIADNDGCLQAFNTLFKRREGRGPCA